MIARRSATAVLAALVLATGACSAGSPDGGSDLPTPSAEQEARWALPLDDFVLSPVESAVLNQAEQYVSKDCMEAQGQPWQVVAVSEAQLSLPARSPSGIRIFNEQVASAYGYQFPSIYPPDIAAARAQLNSQKLTATQQSVFDGCVTKAQDQLGVLDATQLSNDIVGRDGDAWDGAIADPSVKKAAEQWRSCMAPQGIPDLPDAPYGTDGGMPTASQAAAWGQGATDSASQATASAAEIAAAQADAACRTSSGYTHALYQAMWRLEAKALKDDPSLADDGQRARQTYDKALTDSRAVLAAHGGA